MTPAPESLPGELAGLIERHLRGTFRLGAFRDGQREIVASVVAGRDTLVVMPTGGGKSLCYQLPALVLPGLTLVVSPLIALMKDQVDGLKELGVAAECLHSGLTEDEQRAVIDRVVAGAAKLLFVAPERLRNAWFRGAVSRVRVALAAVDEAHCVSVWGHDFRPDYLRIPQTLAALGNPPVVALTATATPEVRDDIVRHLGMREPVVFMRGFDRPNLRYAVRRFRTDDEKDAFLIDYLRLRQPGPGIIYAATRKAVERVESTLRAAGLACGKYHAGMGDEERAAVQEAFMAGAPRVIAATNAFGMGIDKADLRFVVHYHFPRSVEALSQETGRAGRDGLDADAILLYSAKDRFIQEFFIDGANPDRVTIRRVYDALVKLGAGKVELAYADLARRVAGKEINEMKVASAVKCLEEQGFLRRMDRQEKEAALDLPADRNPLLAAASSRSAARNRLALLLYRHKGSALRVPLQELADRIGVTREQLQRELHHLAAEGLVGYEPAFRGRGIMLPDEVRPFDRFDSTRVEAKRKRETEKLEAVIRYAYAGRCRRRFILDYFADPAPRLCGNCDVCRGDDRPRPAPAASPSAPAGARRAAPRRAAKPKEAPGDPLAAGVAPAGGAPGNPAEVVVRLVASLRRAYGRGMVVDLLSGSRKKDVLERGLERAEGYGALAALPRASLEALVDGLVRAGVLRESGPRRYRVLKLGDPVSPRPPRD